MILRRCFCLLIFAVLSLQLAGCVKILRTAIKPAQGVNPNYFARPLYYPGKHLFCQYDGPHVHYSKWGGPVSVTNTDPSVIKKNYRTPGIDEALSDFDDQTFN